MSDFLGNPEQYIQRAQHTSILVENPGNKPVTLSVQRTNIFSKLLDYINIKKRKSLRDLHDKEIINANSERLNQDAQENLDFQAEGFGTLSNSKLKSLKKIS